MSDDYDLLPCPFCGDNSCLLEVQEADGRRDIQLLNKKGHVRKRVSISHQVHCGYCGAMGAPSYNHDQSNSLLLTSVMVSESKEAAVLAWNLRQPFCDDALKLVSKLLKVALASDDE